MRLLCLLLLLLSTLTSTDSITIDEVFQQAETTTTTATTPGTESTSQPLKVGVYYYPWHGDDFHRGDGYLRKELQPPQRPMLGEYDDRRPEVVSQHLYWSRQASISLWVCSWWGPNSREDQTIRQAILKHPELGKDHKIALLYEGSGRGLKASTNWDTSNVYADLQYVCSTYFQHPNYYRIQGKPVVVVYLTRQLQSKGILQDVITRMRTAVRDSCSSDVFIVGDHVWNYPSPNTGIELLDAVTNYDVYGNVGVTPYAGQTAIDGHYKEQQAWKAYVNSRNIGYIPGIGPGYNDRGVRLSANNPGLSRQLDANSEHGTLFATHVTRARNYVDATVDNLLLVNSWNEWHEGTCTEFLKIIIIITITIMIHITTTTTRILLHSQIPRLSRLLLAYHHHPHLLIIRMELLMKHTERNI
jgi:hypothetical protein